jgi:hypothetical protein
VALKIHVTKCGAGHRQCYKQVEFSKDLNKCITHGKVFLEISRLLNTWYPVVINVRIIIKYVIDNI